MAQFSSGTPSTFTPTASTTTLAAGGLQMLTVGDIAKVKMFNWGGDGSSLVGYISRVARVSNTPAGAVSTAGVISASSPGITPNCTYPIVYATTQPTGTADAFLFKQNWNVQGGGGAVVLPIGGEWFVTGGALGTAYSALAWGNITGADANLSNYGLTWEE
jgi:hypothetical protein